MERKVNRSKKNKLTIFDLIAVLVIVGILVAILVPNFKKYSIDSKKVEVKSVVREFIMAVEKAEINDEVEFSDTDSIQAIKDDKGGKIVLINKYLSKLEGIDKIKDLTIGEAKQIINNEVDFEVNKEGQFVRVVKKN